MEYHSVIKKNKIKPFAATWMDMEFITVNEVSLRKTNIIYHLYVETNTNDTDELIYKPETDSKISKSNLQFPKEKHEVK